LFFSFQLSPSTVDRKTRYQTKSPQRGCRARLSQTKARTQLVTIIHLNPVVAVIA
jgi:hypothetical protein